MINIRNLICCIVVVSEIHTYTSNTSNCDLLFVTLHSFRCIYMIYV